MKLKRFDYVRAGADFSDKPLTHFLHLALDKAVCLNDAEGCNQFLEGVLIRIESLKKDLKKHIRGKSNKITVTIVTNDLPLKRGKAVNLRDKKEILSALDDLQTHLSNTNKAIFTKGISRCTHCKYTDGATYFEWNTKVKNMFITFRWDDILYHAMKEHNIIPSKEFRDAVIHWYKNLKRKDLKHMEDKA